MVRVEIALAPEVSELTVRSGAYVIYMARGAQGDAIIGG